MDLEKSFRLTLRELREQSGKSQECLAGDSELDRTYISMLERGKRQPTLSTLIKISNALDIPLSEMIKKAEDRCEE